MRNLTQAQRVDLGFDPHNVFTARLDTLNIGLSEARSSAFYDELHRRLNNLPGVESASLSFGVPLGWVFGSYIAAPEGDDKDDVTEAGDRMQQRHARLLQRRSGFRIERGRGFTDQDAAGSKRVAIINQVLASRFWPGQDPIGKRIEISALPGQPWEVVGVAGMTKNFAIFEYPLPYFYIPSAQNPSSLRTLSVRSAAPIDDIRLRVEREIAALEPELPIADAKSLDEMIGGNIGFVLFRVGAWQATSMGVLGLALAIIGVYGVVSYQTTQREKEIGIRMALGAVPWDVRRSRASARRRDGAGRCRHRPRRHARRNDRHGTDDRAGQHHGSDHVHHRHVGPRHRCTRCVLPAGKTGDKGAASDGVTAGVTVRQVTTGTSGTTGARNELTLAIIL